MTTLTSNSVNFPSSTLYDGDLQSLRTLLSSQVGRWAWGHNSWPASSDYGGNQTARGVYYVSRQIYGTTTLRDGYGNPYTGAGLYYYGNNIANSYDSLSYINASVGRTISVLIELNIGRSTDDATNSIVFRGGSPTGTPAASTGHSGGTQIYTTGATTQTSFFFFDTIPPNTTYTYWHYCGITGGSGGDGCTAWMNIKFANFS